MQGFRGNYQKEDVLLSPSIIIPSKARNLGWCGYFQHPLKISPSGRNDNVVEGITFLQNLRFDNFHETPASQASHDFRSSAT